MSAKNIVPVSLCCTVFNEESTIAYFLDSIFSGSVLPQEIIIVDGGSSDHTLGLLKSYTARDSGVRLIIIESATRVNIAVGRNVAIGSASLSVIAVTDAGCRIDFRWLEMITAPLLSESNVDVVSGWYVPAEGSDFQNRVADATMPNLGDVVPTEFLPSSRSIAFRKSCWEAVGGYPEWLTFAGEDTLFDISLRRAGFCFQFCPEAVVVWEMRQNLKSLYRQYYLYGFGDGESGVVDRSYLFGLAILIFPLLFVFSKKRFSNFGIRYIIRFACVLGWVKGKWKKTPLFT